LTSSGKRDEVDHHKKLLQIEKLTDLDVCAEDAENSKPHAEIFEVVLKKLENIAPERMLAIGDTPYDAEAAAKANIRTIGLLGGGFPESELTDAGAIATQSVNAEMPDVGLTSSSEPLQPDYKVIIKYTVEVEGLAVYTETYDIEKLRREIEMDERTIREIWFRRLTCVIGCRHRPGFSACLTRCLVDG
jgi:haloacid dehalogenase-like hydrolase